MSFITEKVKEMSDGVARIAVDIDAELGVVPDEPLLSQQAPDPVFIQNLDLEDDTEKWRKRADIQMASLGRAFWSVAILSVIGILCVVCVTLIDLDAKLDAKGMPKLFQEILTETVWVLVAAAALAVNVHHRTNKSEQYNDGDCKDSKKRQQDDNRMRLLALFLFFSALLIALTMIWYSISDSITADDLEPFSRSMMYRIVREGWRNNNWELIANRLHFNT